MHALVMAWFLATAYCHDGQTRSGVHTKPGVIAADPRVLPIGSRVRVTDRGTTGVYTVLDTGHDIKGRKIDVYISSCARAKKFGERRVRVQVLRRRQRATLSR